MADEVIRCGGHHIGFCLGSWVMTASRDWIEVDLEREYGRTQEKMREDTCAVIALPGGIGTLDELIGTFTLAKLGKYAGKIYALNIGGFYEPLKALLDHYVSTGMLDGTSRKLIAFPDTVDALIRDFN